MPQQGCLRRHICNIYLYELQSGFSTVIFNRIMSNSSFGLHSKKQDMKEYVGIVVLDLQKAFDIVNHKIRINKLKAIGLNQIAINWFVSF